MFQTKDMEFVNVSLPWMPEHYAMVPQLVERQLKTEQVCLYLRSLPLNIRLHVSFSQQYLSWRFCMGALPVRKQIE